MPTLEQDKPDIVIVHVGINNFLNPMLANESDENIAEEIINIGKNCQSNSVEKVMISLELSNVLKLILVELET